MDGILQLRDSDRKAMLRLIQRGGEHHVARRAHVLLLLGEGHGVRFIAGVLFCSFELIASVRREYERGGLAAALGPVGRPVRRIPRWWNQLLV